MSENRPWLIRTTVDSGWSRYISAPYLIRAGTLPVQRYRGRSGRVQGRCEEGDDVEGRA